MKAQNAHTHQNLHTKNRSEYQSLFNFEVRA